MGVNVPLHRSDTYSVQQRYLPDVHVSQHAPTQLVGAEDLVYRGELRHPGRNWNYFHHEHALEYVERVLDLRVIQPTQTDGFHQFHRPVEEVCEHQAGLSHEPSKPFCTRLEQTGYKLFECHPLPTEPFLPLHTQRFWYVKQLVHMRHEAAFQFVLALQSLPDTRQVPFLEPLQLFQHRRVYNLSQPGRAALAPVEHAELFQQTPNRFFNLRYFHLSTEHFGQVDDFLQDLPSRPGSSFRGLTQPFFGHDRSGTGQELGHDRLLARFQTLHDAHDLFRDLLGQAGPERVEKLRPDFGHFYIRRQLLGLVEPSEVSFSAEFLEQLADHFVDTARAHEPLTLQLLELHLGLFEPELCCNFLIQALEYVRL